MTKPKQLSDHRDRLKAPVSMLQPWHRLFSIANQLRFGLLFLVLLSLLPTGGLLIYLSAQTQLLQAQALQQERSQAAAGQIDNYLDDLKRKLSYLARVKGLTNFQRPVQQSLLEGLVRHNEAYEAVALLDRTGQVVTAATGGTPLQAKSWANSPLFIHAFKQQEDYVSPVELDAQTHQPTTLLAVPIRNDQDEVDGVLMARVKLNFLGFIVSQTVVGKTGDIYVVDERNVLIAQKSSRPETFQLQDLANRPFLKNLVAAAKDKRLNRYQGLHQVDVLGASAFVRSVNWYVVVELPTAEAYAPVQQLVWVMGAALSVVTLVVVVVGFLAARQIVVPLKRLTTAATQLSQGQLQTKVNLSSRNELGTLAIAFNEMATQLEGSLTAVETERNFVAAILDIAGALVIVLDPQGRVVRFNRACERVTNYSFMDIKNQPLWQLFVNADVAQQTKTEFESLTVSSFPRQYEGVWDTTEGVHKLVAWSDTVLLNDQGAIAYVIKTGIDITDRKQAEEELRASEQRLSLLFRQTPLAVVEWNTQFEVTAWNPSAERIFGYSAAVAIGRHALELIVPSTARPLVQQVMDALLKQRGGSNSVNENITQDGRTIVCEWYNTPLADEAGRVTGVASLALDITDRTQAETALKQAKEEAETALQTLQQTQGQLIQAEKMSGLGQLVAGVAHEINNPVNFIYGNLTHTAEYTHDLLELAQLYQQKYAVPDAQIDEKLAQMDFAFMIEDLPKMLSSMKVGADRIRQIVLSLRNFSRLDEAEMKPVDIHEGIDSTLMILQSRLKATADHPAIEIVKDYGALPLVECYAGQLNQVFMNILANAIDALDGYNKQRSVPSAQREPSQITIRTKLVTDKHQTNHVNRVAIQIQDNGPGMTALVQQQLFNPFFTTKPTGKGTGLGLSISYQIVVDKHHGSLHCVSQPGQGSEFWLKIPVWQSGMPSQGVIAEVGV
ncbi:PAS domain S-box protein [Stenomitos frigidus]|uniref:histidine kinase n=1 Tax=Stenomitos frigidus ULC18 TaxID=2107698 RepID=A0A2T1E8S4_9CYAN|nr:PAS domain S-box protein [Stenomitos frigidus]PSB29085.1 histidine kinase [Stenomitos frigidus ULC18]